MLHGYGSKKGIFDAFSKYVEDDFPVVVINGLFTKFNAKKVCPYAFMRFSSFLVM